MGRPTCLRCRRAAAFCWCERVRAFTTAARFAILMHPKESRVAIGTGRLAHHALLGSTLLVAERFDDDARLARLVADPALFPVVLFTRPGALDVSTATPAEARAFFPPDRQPLVLVPDGTWTTAKKLIRLSRLLQELPAIRFTPDDVARYDRLRKEPRAECRSTIEAVHHIIDRLDALGVAPAPPGRAHDHLITLLDAVVDAQMAFEPPIYEPATRGDRQV